MEEYDARVEGRALTPPLSLLHTPFWALAQPVSQVQGRPDLQPALGWGRQPGTHRQAGHEGARCPHQNRLGPGPRHCPKALDGPGVNSHLKFYVMKVERVNQHEILNFNDFIFTNEKPRPRARGTCLELE